MMRALASDESKISFEGELSNTELARIEGVVHESTEVLKKNTLWPNLDFLILPLATGNLPAIEKAIISKIAFGNRGIIHVQIECDGRIAFAAYDGFDPECVVAFPPVPVALLQELTETGVLRNYTLSTR